MGKREGVGMGNTGRWFFCELLFSGGVLGYFNVCLGRTTSAQNNGISLGNKAAGLQLLDIASLPVNYAYSAAFCDTSTTSDPNAC